MKRLTKREKVIILTAMLVGGAMVFGLNRRLTKYASHYNGLANKLCSGGVWAACDITEKSFKLKQMIP